jgi:ribosome-associated translation inhibitor RaiA
LTPVEQIAREFPGGWASGHGAVGATRDGMDIPTEISFIGMAPSPAVEAAVRMWIARLARHQDRIQYCHVTIALSHRHNHHVHRFQVRITIAIPGREIAVTHDRCRDGSREDVYMTLADAFGEARRQLWDRADAAIAAVHETPAS